MQIAFVEIVGRNLQVFVSDLYHWVILSFDASMLPSAVSEFPNVPVSDFEQLPPLEKTGI